MRKVGIMGGTFNPIHYGHLILAEHAYEEMHLDTVLFMPSKNPPHKQNSAIASEKHRLQMIRLAIGDNSHFDISTLEQEREGLTYTADTLTILTKENPDTHYFFIVGADSLLMMDTWKEPQKVFSLSTILVAGRNNMNEDRIQSCIEEYERRYDALIYVLNMPNIEISSKFIRYRVAAGKSVKYYLPDSICDYIADSKLYQANS